MTIPADDHRRAAELRAALDELRVPDPVAGRDRLLTRIGAGALVGGPGLGVLAWFGSHGTTNPLSQRDYLVVALIGVAVTVAGAALFVRGSMAQFLRFWFLRLIIEQRAPTTPTDLDAMPRKGATPLRREGEGHEEQAT